jgi:hypothetical protein
VLAVEIAQYLQARGLGVFDELGSAGSIFIALLPESPDEVIGIYPKGGHQADGPLPYDAPVVQVIVRGTQDPRPAAERAQGVYDALHGFHHDKFVPEGTWILGCRGVQSGPIHIGRDQNGRHEYSLNFELQTLNERRE